MSSVLINLKSMRVFIPHRILFVVMVIPLRLMAMRYNPAQEVNFLLYLTLGSILEM